MGWSTWVDWGTWSCLPKVVPETTVELQELSDSVPASCKCTGPTIPTEIEATYGDLSFFNLLRGQRDLLEVSNGRLKLNTTWICAWFMIILGHVTFKACDSQAVKMLFAFATFLQDPWVSRWGLNYGKQCGAWDEPKCGDLWGNISLGSSADFWDHGPRPSLFLTSPRQVNGVVDHGAMHPQSVRMLTNPRLCQDNISATLAQTYQGPCQLDMRLAGFTKAVTWRFRDEVLRYLHLYKTT